MASEPITHLRAHTLADALAVVPCLLRFHPRDSLVLMAVVDRIVQVTARVDLARVSSRALIADALGPVISRFPQASFLGIVYCADAEPAWAALADLGAVLPDPEALTVAYVDGVHWYANPLDEGLPYDPASSAIAAGAAYAGISVLRDRGELVASLDPVFDVAEMEAALLAELTDGGPARVLRKGMRLAQARMRRPRDLTLSECAVLGACCFHAGFVDRSIRRLERPDAERAVRLWTQVVRGTQPASSAYAAVILGMAAWLLGDGAMQVVCLERAIHYEPETPWFNVLDIVNRVALPPDQWDVLRAGLDEPLWDEPEWREAG